MSVPRAAITQVGRIEILPDGSSLITGWHMEPPPGADPLLLELSMFSGPSGELGSGLGGWSIEELAAITADMSEFQS